MPVESLDPPREDEERRADDDKKRGVIFILEGATLEVRNGGQEQGRFFPDHHGQATFLPHTIVL